MEIRFDVEETAEGRLELVTEVQDAEGIRTVGKQVFTEGDNGQWQEDKRPMLTVHPGGKSK